MTGVSLKDRQAYLLQHLKIAASNRTASPIRPAPPYSRAPAASSSEGPTTYESLDKPALKPLPVTAYQYAQWRPLRSTSITMWR
ncbi:hypothetical protein DFAR_3510004 [Desulfarculales bacterium]